MSTIPFQSPTEAMEPKCIYLNAGTTLISLLTLVLVLVGAAAVEEGGAGVGGEGGNSFG